MSSIGVWAGRVAYDALNRIQYMGKAPAGAAENAAVWSIKRLTYDGTSQRYVAEEFPNGDSSLMWRWDLRDTYTYS